MPQNSGLYSQQLKVFSWLVMVSLGIVSGSLAPLLVPMADFYHWEISQAAFPVVLRSLGFLSANFIFSFIWRIHKTRPLLTFSPLFLFLSLFAIVLFHNNWGIVLFLLFFAGLGAGLLHPSVNSLFSEMYGKNRTKYLNISMMFFGLGAFLGPLLVGAILTYGLKWYIVYFLLALIFFPFIVVFSRKNLYQGILFSKKEKAPNNPLKKQLINSPFFWLLALANFVIVGGQVSFFSWIPLFLTRVRDVSPAVASYSVSIFWLSMICGRVLYSRFLHKTNLSLSLIVGAGGAALFTALSFLCPQGILVVVFLLGSGLFFSFISPGLFALGGNIFPENIGFMTGISTASIGVGCVFFPWLIGVTSQRVGVATGVLLIPLLSVGGIGILIYLRYFLAKKVL